MTATVFPGQESHLTSQNCVTNHHIGVLIAEMSERLETGHTRP